MDYPPRKSVYLAEDRISHAFKTNAATLCLADLDLEYLPDSIGALPELRELQVGRKLGLHYGCSLRALTPAIGGARQLQTLNLECNHLIELPDSIGQLVQLRSLKLGYNELDSLPASFGQLTQLEYLDLGDNFLAALPASFRHLRALQTLFLHGNSALGIPAEILGPEAHEVASGRARPAAPQAILDYYFAR